METYHRQQMPMEDAKTQFGQRLRLLRKSQHLTLEKLGRISDIGYKHIADIERGEKVPSFEAIEKLARALKVPIQELFAHEMVDQKSGGTLVRMAREIDKNASPAIKQFATMMLTRIKQLETDLISK